MTISQFRLSSDSQPRQTEEPVKDDEQPKKLSIAERA